MRTLQRPPERDECPFELGLLHTGNCTPCVHMCATQSSMSPLVMTRPLLLSRPDVCAVLPIQRVHAVRSVIVLSAGQKMHNC
jgi:hypothetical protein